GRSSVKANLAPLVLLALVYFAPAASAQSPVQRTCLFGCRCNRGGPADPAMMQLLQTIADNQKQILALLQQQHAQPAAPHLIVLGPQQQIPLGGPPLQQIPLGGPPRQDIPLGGPPKQDVPLGDPPKQDLPLGPAPRQNIPLGPDPGQPIPKAGTTGVQRYTVTPTYFWQPGRRD